MTCQVDNREQQSRRSDWQRAPKTRVLPGRSGPVHAFSMVADSSGRRQPSAPPGRRAAVSRQEMDRLLAVVRLPATPIRPGKPSPQNTGYYPSSLLPLFPYAFPSNIPIGLSECTQQRACIRTRHRRASDEAGPHPPGRRRRRSRCHPGAWRTAVSLRPARRSGLCSQPPGERSAGSRDGPAPGECPRRSHTIRSTHMTNPDSIFSHHTPRQETRAGTHALRAETPRPCRMPANRVPR